jgi:hypothetical protein
VYIQIKYFFSSRIFFLTCIKHQETERKLQLEDISCCWEFCPPNITSCQGRENGRGHVRCGHRLASHLPETGLGYSHSLIDVRTFVFTDTCGHGEITSCSYERITRQIYLSSHFSKLKAAIRLVSTVFFNCIL